MPERRQRISKRKLEARQTPAAIDIRHHGDYQKLLESLTGQNEFRLVLLRFNDYNYRDQLIDTLDQQLDNSGIYRVQGEDLGDFIIFAEALVEAGNRYEVVQVVDLQHWALDHDPETLFRGFVQHRSVLEGMKKPLLLWFTDAEIKLMTQKAPELGSQYNQVYDFTAPIEAPALPRPSSLLVQSRQEVHQRIKELEHYFSLQSQREPLLDLELAALYLANDQRQMAHAHWALTPKEGPDNFALSRGMVEVQLLEAKGKLDDALTLAEDLAEKAQSAGEQRLAYRLMVLSAKLQGNLGLLNDAVTTLGKARGKNHTLAPPLAEAEIQFYLGNLYLEARQYGAARTCYHAGLNLAERAASLTAPMMLMLADAHLASELDRPEEALSLAKGALERAQGLVALEWVQDLKLYLQELERQFRHAPAEEGEEGETKNLSVIKKLGSTITKLFRQPKTIPLEEPTPTGWNKDEATLPLVLVSYCGDNQTWARRLMRVFQPLEERPFRLWDQREFPPGPHFRTEWEQALNHAAMALVFVSNTYIYERAWEWKPLLAKAQRSNFQLLCLPVEEVAPDVLPTDMTPFLHNIWGPQALAELTAYEGDEAIAKLAGTIVRFWRSQATM